MDFARRLRLSMEEFGAGDPTLALSLWSPTVRWTAVGQSPTAGRYHGHEGVLGYLGELMRLSRGSFRPEVLEVRPMAEGTYVARFRNRASVPGADLDVFSSLILDREGDVISAIVEVQHDEGAWDAFWSQAAVIETDGGSAARPSVAPAAARGPGRLQAPGDPAGV